MKGEPTMWHVNWPLVRRRMLLIVILGVVAWAVAVQVGG